MMQLLAKTVKLAIDKKYIIYEELYSYTEKKLFKLLKEQKDEELQNLIDEFESKKLIDIPKIELPNVKIRDLNPIVNGKRIK